MSALICQESHGPLPGLPFSRLPSPHQKVCRQMVVEGIHVVRCITKLQQQCTASSPPLPHALCPQQPMCTLSAAAGGQHCNLGACYVPNCASRQQPRWLCCTAAQLLLAPALFSNMLPLIQVGLG